MFSGPQEQPTQYTTMLTTRGPLCKINKLFNNSSHWRKKNLLLPRLKRLSPLIQINMSMCSCRADVVRQHKIRARSPRKTANRAYTLFLAHPNHLGCNRKTIDAELN